MAKNYFGPMKKAFKGKNKVAWGIGALVVFVFFYLAFSKQSNGSETAANSGNVLVQGPSEAEIMAQLQSSALALEANTSLQQSQIQAGVAMQELELAGTVAALQFQASESSGERELELGRLALGAESELQRLGIEASLASQQMTTDIAMTQIHSQNHMFTSQLAANRDMFMAQMDASRFQSLVGSIGQLKRKDRDTALGALTAAYAGYGFSGGSGDDFISIGGGSGSLLPPPPPFRTA